ADVHIPRVDFIGNLIMGDEDRDFLEKELGKAPIAFFPDSTAIRMAERREQPLVDIDPHAQGAPQLLMETLLKNNL
ncbi:MAG: carbon monoxide dehydrogenase, partial [Thermodesulfobacteriota bacterium]